MHRLPLLTFLLLLRVNDGFVGAVDSERGYDVVLATLGVTLTLKCPYTCSAGWTRASWHLQGTGASTCFSCFQETQETVTDGSLCTELLSLKYVSVNQTSYNYTCFSVVSDDPLLSQRIERQILVRVQAPPSAPVVTVAQQGDVWAGRPLEVTCTVQGFSPTNVVVTWSINGSPVAGTDELIARSNADGTFYALSKISFTPIAFQHGGVLTCEAHHASLSDPLRANITLDIKYLSLHVSYNDDRESIEELLLPSNTIRTRAGTYLKLLCLVDSNPPTTGKWVTGNVTPSRQNIGTPATLTLDKVKVEDAGIYSCSASTGYETMDVIVTVEVENPGEFSWLKVLAAAIVTVATVLAAVAVYFSLSSRRKRNAHLPTATCKSGTSNDELRVETPLVTGESALKWERVAVTFTPADCQSDHEVPYAEIIMISVRGSSTPELTHIPDPTPREYRQRWKEEGGPGGLLQVSHSADRLHVHQRDVTRKLSTNSEYAVIQYRSEPLG